MLEHQPLVQKGVATIIAVGAVFLSYYADFPGFVRTHLPSISEGAVRTVIPLAGIVIIAAFWVPWRLYATAWGWLRLHARVDPKLNPRRFYLYVFLAGVLFMAIVVAASQSGSRWTSVAWAILGGIVIFAVSEVLKRFEAVSGSAHQFYAGGSVDERGDDPQPQREGLPSNSSPLALKANQYLESLPDWDKSRIEVEASSWFAGGIMSLSDLDEKGRLNRLIRISISMLKSRANRSVLSGDDLVLWYAQLCAETKAIEDQLPSIAPKIFALHGDVLDSKAFSTADFEEQHRTLVSIVRSYIAAIEVYSTPEQEPKGQTGLQGGREHKEKPTSLSLVKKKKRDLQKKTGRMYSAAFQEAHRRGKGTAWIGVRAAIEVFDGLINEDFRRMSLEDWILQVDMELEDFPRKIGIFTNQVVKDFTEPPPAFMEPRNFPNAQNVDHREQLQRLTRCRDELKLILADLEARDAQV